MQQEQAPSGFDYMSVLSSLNHDLKKGAITLDELGQKVPGFVHINSRMDLAMLDINYQGQRMLGYTLDEIKTMGPAMLVKHQSAWTLNVVYPKLFMHFTVPDQNQPFTFVQDWIFSKRVKKKYYLLSTTHILNDVEYLTFTIPLEAITKLDRLKNRTDNNQALFDEFYQKIHQLTNRETQVFKLLAKNKTRNAISEDLFLSTYTVKKHCENIYQKLGTNSRIVLHQVAKTFNV